MNTPVPVAESPPLDPPPPVLTRGVLSGMAILSILLPLLFFYHLPDLIVNRGLAILMVDEYIKFAFMICGASLILLMAAHSLGHQGKLPLPPKWIGIFSAVFGTALLGSLFQCTSGMLCFQGTLEIYLLPPLLFLLLASVAPLKQAWIKNFLWAILSAGFVTAIFGILQNHDELKTFANMIPHLGSGGLLFNQNLAGEYLILIIPASLFLLLLERRPHLQLMALIVSGLMLYHLVLTLARGAWLGLIVGTLLTLVIAMLALRKAKVATPGSPPPRSILRRAAPWILPPLAAGLLFLATAPKDNRFISEFASIFTKGSPERIDIWKDSLGILKEKWATGIGPDNYRAIINVYLREGAKHTKWNYTTGTYRYPFRTHNDYYQTLLELGVLGLAAKLGLFVSIAWFAFLGLQSAWRQRQRDRFLLLLATSSGFGAFAVSMFFEFPMRMPTTAVIGWILAGLTVNMGKKAEETRFIPLAKSGENILATLGVILMVLSFFLAKDLFVGSIYRSHAVVGFAQRQIEASYVWASRATEITPWIEHVVVDKMRIDLSRGRFDQAIESANAFMRHQPYIPAVHMYRTEALARKGDWIAAQKAVNDLTRLFPFIPEGWKVKEFVDQRINELAKGEYAQEKTTALPPKQP